EGPALSAVEGPALSAVEGSVITFLESLQANHISDNTIRSYSADIRRLMEFLQQRGRCELAEIKPADIDLFFRQITLEEASASTIRRTRAGLKKFFRFLFENGTVASDPFRDASLEESFTDRLTLSSIVNILVYCRRHYETESNEGAFRYRRNELILLLMIIHGIRQYHIPALKLSAMKKDGSGVLVAVSDQFSLRIEGIVLQKLFQYLKQRDSKADVIFVEPGTGKPVIARSLHAMMIELSYAVRAQVNPRTLHHSFLHLQHHPDDASQLLRELSKLDEEVTC
ncbi:MAG: site-specific integrase, partial [bacterium]